MIKTKRAAVGETLTWMFAVIIIFFMIIIFLAFTSFLALNKESLGISSKENDMDRSIIKTTEDLETQRQLFYLINSPLEGKTTLKNLILNWKLTGSQQYKEKISANLRNLLEERGCYLFRVDGVTLYSKSMRISEDSNIARTTLFFDNKKIDLELYSKKC